MKILWIIGVAAVALVLGLLMRQALVAPPATPATQTASSANPILALKLPDLMGVTQPLNQWQGKILVVNFWATWCGPCRDEMPELSQFQRNHPEVQVVGIGIDKPSSLQKFSREHPVSYPLLAGNDDTFALTRPLGNEMEAFPFTLVYNQRGQLVEHFLGRITLSDLNRALAHASATP
jgi:thiol-disulfide isomerase/thioredoxin